MNLSDCLYLSPRNIHYSQDTISATFQDGTKIGRTLDALVNMEIFVIDIPPITVVRYRDKFFSKNNRRLWVFKQLCRMGRCDYIPTIRMPHLPRTQFTTEIDGHEILIRGDHGSFNLQNFLQIERGQTMQNVRALREGPLTPSLRYTFNPRFKDLQKWRRNRYKNKRKSKGTKRLEFGSSEPEPEVSAYDFNQYSAMAVPRIDFSAETEMVFGEKAHVTKRRKTDPVWKSIPVIWHTRDGHQAVEDFCFNRFESRC